MQRSNVGYSTAQPQTDLPKGAQRTASRPLSLIPFRFTAPAFAAIVALTACGGGGEEATDATLSHTEVNTQSLQNDGIVSLSMDSDNPLSGDSTLASLESDENDALTTEAERRTVMSTPPIWSGIDSFANFYNKKFQPFAASQARKELLRQFKIQNPNGPTLVESVIKDPELFNTYYSTLNSKRATAFRDNLRKTLTTNFTSYTSNELANNVNWVKNNSSHAFNIMEQHREPESLSAAFFLSSVEPPIVSIAYAERRRLNEEADDLKYVPGTTPDKVQDFIDVDGRPSVRVVLGNNRPPVERVDAVPAVPWPGVTQMMFTYPLDPRTVEDKWVEYGPPSKTILPTEGNPNSNEGETTHLDYDTTGIQSEAFAYYVKRDLETYGALPNMSVDQSRATMIAIGRFLLPVSGNPYDAYARTQVAARFVAQAVTLAARGAILKKWINIPALSAAIVQGMENAVVASDAATQRWVKTTALMTAGAITANIIGTVGTYYYARELDENRTEKSDAKEFVRDMFQSFLAVEQPISAFVSWKLLIDQTLRPSLCNTNAAHWIPAAFGVNDFLTATGQIVDAAYSFGDGTYSNAWRITTFTSAAVNLMSSGYNFFKTLNQIKSWKYTRYNEVIRPITVATAASALSCVASAYKLAYIGR